MKKYNVIFLMFIVLIFVSCAITDMPSKTLNVENKYQKEIVLIHQDTSMINHKTIIKSIDTNSNILKIEIIDNIVDYRDKIKIIQIYNNGILQSELPYKNGIIDGTLRFFYDDGTICREATYVDGVLNGSSIDFNETGMPYRISNFKNGKLFGKYIIYKDNMEIEWEAYIYNDIKLSQPLEELLTPETPNFLSHDSIPELNPIENKDTM